MIQILLRLFFRLPFAALYGSMTLFLTIVHNVFLLYYVDMFVSIYKIDKLSFWLGEIAFLIWNSVNDPLFGWMSDRGLLQTSNLVHPIDIVLLRLKRLSWSGPLFAISFSLFWFKWFHPGLQFIICLCLYDGFLTTVELQHTALLADLAVRAHERTLLNKNSSVFSAVGSISVFMSYMFWNKTTQLPFQVFCICVALFSVVGFLISTRCLISHCETQKKLREDFIKYGELDQRDAHLGSSIGFNKYLKQLVVNHNFRWFISMNLLQVFHCHFNSNFFPLFLDTLIGDAVSPGVGPFLLGISFVLPHVNNLYFLKLCKQHGVYKVINWLFYIKLMLAVVMLIMGSKNIWFLCVFIASNRVFTEGTCKLLNLVVSDLVDEDVVTHERDQAASALLFGVSSLLSKPGQTLAPLIGTSLIAFYTGEDIFNKNSFVPIQPHDHSSSSWLSKQEACFALLTVVPILCAVLQIIAWSRFTLHGSRLAKIKSAR
uniref:Transmembrane protein 180 n=1 Tax=Ciona savignyi TaxID=51511 RepID=H2YZM5_CIOSA